MLSKEDFHALLVKYSNAYYNSGKPLVSDEEFDRLVQEYETHYNTSFAYLGKANNKKVTLPIKMPSLNKIKEQNAIDLFVRQITKLYSKHVSGSPAFLISSKIDGVSCLVVREKGQTILMTRGDGSVGSDISHLLPYLSFTSVLTTLPQTCIIRGELVLYRKDVEKDEIPRNMVSGLVNAKTLNEDLLKLVHFVGYYVHGQSSNEGIKWLTHYAIETPRHSTCSLSKPSLTKMLEEWDRDSPYDIDGLVVQLCDIVESPSIDNPKHSVAFKVQKEKVQTVVERVEWSPSRYGQLCPRVVLSPVYIGGVTITYATAFHARYVVDNVIGPGAFVSIIRSGDVIPYIVSVDRPSSSPDLPPQDTYKWISDIHIAQTNLESKEIKVAKLSHFFSTLQVKGVKEATIEKLVEAGYDTIDKMMSLQLNTLLTIPSLTGLKGNCTAMCEKIAEAISLAHSQLTLELLLVGSSMFPAFGEKKMKQALQAVHVYSILSGQSYIDRKKAIKALHEVSIKTLAETFLDNLEDFLKAYRTSSVLKECLRKEKERIGIDKESQSNISKKSGPIVSKGSVLLTGFRDATIKQTLEERGYTIGSSVSGKTVAVIIKEAGVTNTKTEEANDRGIPILLASEALKRLI